jgi:hypothetical protein
LRALVFRVAFAFDAEAGLSAADGFVSAGRSTGFEAGGVIAN